MRDRARAQHGFGRGLCALLALACQFAGCKDTSPQATPGVRGLLDFRRSTFWSAPLPSEDLREGGTLVLKNFPNAGKVALVGKAVAVLQRDAHGFGVSSGVFLPFSGALPQSALPTVEQSQDPDAKIFLLSIDDDAPDAMTRRPVQVTFETDSGPFGPSNLLALLPVQGRPLAPGHAYAAVVRRTLQPGHLLGVSLGLATLLAGQRPAGLGDDAFGLYQRALAAVTRAGVRSTDLSALAAFTTDDPTQQLSLVRDDVLTSPLPLPPAALRLAESWPDFCVFSGVLKLPVYQAGTPPYTTDGGGWSFDVFGFPQLQRTETANLYVTLPRAVMPQTGWPAVLYAQAGSGLGRPLIDRGPRAAPGGPFAPGEGPALQLAHAGFAGVEVDGPLGGRRNLTHGDEEALLFNLGNPEALRDTLRQGALELAVTARALSGITFETHSCTGTTDGVQRFDPSHLALMGHGAGAQMATLAAAIEPAARALVLGGAGASFLQTLLWKKLPADERARLEDLLGYTALAQPLSDHDPIVSLLQWTLESADPQVYAEQVAASAFGAAARPVLLVQGIVDHAAAPPQVAALAVPLGLDTAGPALDAASQELRLAGFAPLDESLAPGGGVRLGLPAKGNRALGSVTAVDVQVPEDGLDDGHEVLFQSDTARRLYRCFLRSWLSGVPVVPASGPVGAACE